MNYRIWLIQYESRDHLQDMNGVIRILECEHIEARWVSPEVLIVSPESGSLRIIDTK